MSFLDYFKARYGTTIATYKKIAENPERVTALARDLAALAQRHNVGAGPTLMEASLPTRSSHESQGRAPRVSSAWRHCSLGNDWVSAYSVG